MKHPTSTAPNGGQEPGAGMSNATPRDNAPPPIMHPNGVRERVAMAYANTLPAPYCHNSSAKPAGEEVEG